MGIEEVREGWLANPLNPIAFMDYVLYLHRVGLVNEASVYNRIRELYQSVISFAMEDWPNIAACAIGAKDAFIRKVCIELLGQIDPRLSLPALSYIYNQASDEERGICIISMGRSKNSSIISFLTYIFKAENNYNWSIKDDICYALGILDSEAAIPFLCEVVENEDEVMAVRHQALSSIGYINGPLSSVKLSYLLNNKNLKTEFRIKAADILSKNNNIAVDRLFDTICSDVEEDNDLIEWIEDYYDEVKGELINESESF